MLTVVGEAYITQYTYCTDIPITDLINILTTFPTDTHDLPGLKCH